MLFEAQAQLAIARGHCRWLGHHHHVDANQCLAMVPEHLTRHSLETVSLHGVSRDFARNRQSQTCGLVAIASAKHRKKTVGTTLRGIEHRAELVLLVEARGARKPAVAYGQRRARPLARRAFRILRPFLVAMRARNPWVRLRFLTLGWNVLCMTAIFFRSVAERCEPYWSKPPVVNIFKDLRGCG